MTASATKMTATLTGAPDKMPTDPSSSMPPTPGSLDHRTLLALIEASSAIHEELQPAEVCLCVARHAARVLDAEAASVLLYDEPRNELVFHTVVGPPGADVIRAMRFSADLGIAGQVVRTGRPVRVDDVRQNRNFYAEIDDLTKLTTRALLAVPLLHRGEKLGVVEVINRREGKTFDQADLEILQVLANIVAVAAQNAMKFEQLERRSRALADSVPQANFIGAAPAFMSALELCRKVAPASSTVLLTGDTGTGKEMAAQAIHNMSPRAGETFVAVNCAALPESLIESELFGHEKGAFTGATRQSIGRFELADGGTMLLDEIGELELAMQSKLLRVLESQEFTRVGGKETIRCDVRIIAATNRDLKAHVDAGSFREDLYYRLSVFPIHLPRLRERREDLPLLVEHLLSQIAPRLGGDLPTVTDEALQCMARYTWPGNVRELRNVVERAALLADGPIGPEHLPSEIARADENGGATSGAETTSVLAETERELILEALEETNWNQSAAARRLGISRDILRYRIKRYSLTRAGG
ncbi:MAG: GAF domain-containing protein [Planctomycetes bacterium]|nr:GAF domain-containing protein [Planctomycetota bacterium]